MELIGLYFSIYAVPEMFLKCITPEAFNCGRYNFYNHECIRYKSTIFLPGLVETNAGRSVREMHDI